MSLQIDKGFESLGSVFAAKLQQKKKAPAHPWQELALRVINELGIPNFKRSAVFKVCKENTKIFVEQCMNDTKELCQTGTKWQYFFKVVDGAGANGPRPVKSQKFKVKSLKMSEDEIEDGKEFE